MIQLETKKKIVKVILDILVFLVVGEIPYHTTDNRVVFIFTGMFIVFVCKQLNKIIDESEDKQC